MPDPPPDPPLVNWPANLVKQIAAGHWFLFIGAGVSATCENVDGDSPPDWADLLKGLVNGLPDSAHKTRASDLIDARDFTEAAELIRWTYASLARTEDYLSQIKRAVLGPVGREYQPSPLLDSLLALSPNIVVTTNYDRLFEMSAAGGFDPLLYRSPNVGSAIRRGDPTLLKIHGSTEEMDEIVLTRGDYVRVKRYGAHALEVLRALFLTHTALFVGYSVSDPDIQLLLEASGPGATNPESHYLVTRSGVPAHRVEAFKNFFGVSCLEYDQAHDLLEVVDELVPLVQAQQQVYGS